MHVLKKLFVILLGLSSYLQATAPSSSNFLMDLELLYWKANEGHLQFANRPQLIDTTDDFTTTSLVTPDFKRNFGFRGVFGYSSPETKWDCLARFTHIVNKARGNTNTGTVLEEVDGSSDAFFPVLSTQSSLTQGDYVFSSSMNWKVLLNFYDLYAGYRFQPMKWLGVTPYFGLRGAEVNQSLKVAYSGGIFVTGTDQISITNKYWGIGPLLSIDPEIDIYKGLTLPLSVGGALLLGKLNLKQNEQYFSTTLSEFHDRSFKLRGLFDFSAALKYGFSFLKGRYVAAFSAGWEYHLLFDQNFLHENQFHLLKGSRNLSLRGVFFSAQLQF